MIKTEERRNQKLINAQERRIHPTGQPTGTKGERKREKVDYTGGSQHAQKNGKKRTAAAILELEILQKRSRKGGKGKKKGPQVAWKRKKAESGRKYHKMRIFRRCGTGDDKKESGGKGKGVGWGGGGGAEGGGVGVGL